MDKMLVLEVFKSLAKSQGYYCRLLDLIFNMDNEAQNAFFDNFKDCKTDWDVIRLVEGF